MTAKVSYDLREQLDQYSVGFPATESGVELKILEKLFSEEEAELYLNLSMMLETPESGGSTNGSGAGSDVGSWNACWKRVSFFGSRKETLPSTEPCPLCWARTSFSSKIWTEEFAELFEQYFLEAFGKKAIGSDASPANRSGQQVRRPFMAGRAIRRREGNL